MTLYEAADFVIRQGDTAPRIIGTLTDGAGAPVDVTGGTVNLHLHGLTVANELDFTASLDGDAADNNVVYYDWQEGDTDDAGYYSGEWEVDVDGQTQTFPNDGVFLVQVTEQLA